MCDVAQDTFSGGTYALSHPAVHFYKQHCARYGGAVVSAVASQVMGQLPTRDLSAWGLFSLCLRAAANWKLEVVCRCEC